MELTESLSHMPAGGQVLLSDATFHQIAGRLHKIHLPAFAFQCRRSSQEGTKSTRTSMEGLRSVYNKQLVPVCIRAVQQQGTVLETAIVGLVCVTCVARSCQPQMRRDFLTQSDCKNSQFMLKDEFAILQHPDRQPRLCADADASSALSCGLRCQAWWTLDCIALLLAGRQSKWAVCR